MSTQFKYLTESEIEKIARIVRSEQNISDDFFIDISQLAQSLNCEVYEADFVDDNVAGMVHSKDGKHVIKINRSQSEERKRFTIAHELAHVILHRLEGTHIDYRKPYGTFPDSELRKEVQADMLAAALLMPRDLVAQAWPKLQDSQLLATLFRVSSKAAAVRLDSLGLLD